MLDIQVILVPQGVEHRAVCGGLRHTLNPPTVFPIPLGAIAVTARLHQLHQAGHLSEGQQVLVMGLCGSLKAALPVGTGVLYETCTTTAVDQPQSPLACDRALTTAICQELGQGVRRVAAVTSDRVISQAVEKQQLAQHTQADVVDMEGFATLHRLTEWGLSVAALRVVSDDSQHDIPNLAAVIDSNGSLKLAALTVAMLKQPVDALRFMRGSTKSLKILQSLTADLFKNVI